MNGCSLMPGAEVYTAIDNVCAWPNLTLLPNGEIAAAIYDQPSHGFGCGNVALWVSDDDGRRWTYRSHVSDHADHPEQVRMNCAVGLNAHGEIVALVSGWSDGRRPPTLDVQICLSGDAGKSWQRSHWQPPPETGRVPFGDIIAKPDGALVAMLYRRPPNGVHGSFLYRSADHGRTWGDPQLVAEKCGESAPLLCRNGHWLAAARTDKHSPYKNSAFGMAYGDALVVLFRSSDDGQTWEELGPVTLPGQHPAHLLELADGRVVLTYGSRVIGLSGACGRISDDQGQTWAVARPVVTAPGPMDCGYPSSVELNDGTIVTAYYGGPREQGHREDAPCSFPWRQRYHMGVCRWRPEMLAHPLDRIIGTRPV